MLTRPTASATISFGLVSIPVNLYAAAESKAAISFNMLHAKCHSRVKQQYICPKDDGEIVPRDQMVKGYEFAKGQYVIFTEEEIKALAQEASKTIEITEFVPASTVDPIYFDGAYYVGPEPGGERAYKLLAEAMRLTGRAALAKWAARGKQYLVLVRPVEGRLILQQLRYPDEIRSFEQVPIGDSEIKEAELELAKQLVEQIASDEFRPEDYEDEVRKRILEAIQRKVEGEEVTAAPEPPKAQIIDLMQALKASLHKDVPAEAEAADTPRRPAKRAPRPAASARPNTRRRA